MKNAIEELNDLNEFYARNSKRINSEHLTVKMNQKQFEAYFENLKQSCCEVMNQLMGCYVSALGLDVEKAAEELLQNMSRHISALADVHKKNLEGKNDFTTNTDSGCSEDLAKCGNRNCNSFLQ